MVECSCVGTVESRRASIKIGGEAVDDGLWNEREKEGSVTGMAVLAVQGPPYSGGTGCWTRTRKCFSAADLHYLQVGYL